jgi:hypothetical protein
MGRSIVSFCWVVLKEPGLYCTVWGAVERLLHFYGFRGFAHPSRACCSFRGYLESSLMTCMCFCAFVLFESCLFFFLFFFFSFFFLSMDNNTSKYPLSSIVTSKFNQLRLPRLPQGDGQRNRNKQPLSCKHVDHPRATTEPRRSVIIISSILFSLRYVHVLPQTTLFQHAKVIGC